MSFVIASRRRGAKIRFKINILSIGRRHLIFCQLPIANCYNNMSKILGIDLGTTFSAMAVIENSEPKIIENKEGTRTTPSVVTLTKKGEI